MPAHHLAALRASAGFLRHRRRAAAATAIVGSALGEPLHAARRIARASWVRNATFQADIAWLARARPAAVRRRVDAIELPDADDIGRVLGGGERPLLITSLHMGHYASGLLRLARALPGVRRYTLIRRTASGVLEAAVARHLAAHGTVEFVHLGPGCARAALRALAPRSALLLMQDVPPAFGISATRPATLFGHDARLPEGPARLAVAAGARILSIATYRHDVGGDAAEAGAAGDRCTCAPLVDAARCVEFATAVGAHDGAPRAAAIDHVHATLARHMERAIRTHAADWMLWPHLPAFFAAPPAAPATAGASAVAEPPGGAIAGPQPR